MIFFQLILAHLIGDFILQPNSWVLEKEKKKIASPRLYLHILVHTALSFILLFDLKLWWIALIIGVSHFLIDVAKLYLQKKHNKKTWFFIDQFLHFAVIVGLAALHSKFDLTVFLEPEILKLLAFVVFLTTPTSMMIKVFLSSFSPTTASAQELESDSLSNAGKYIGILERLLVFVFILSGHWEGVGFMIAAKSVFRFSDLAQAKQRKLTEYVLIGTLMSFGIAIVSAILIKL